MRFRPEKSYPRPQWPPPYSTHSRRSRGADEASGGRTGSRGRPAPAWMLTTGRYGLWGTAGFVLPQGARNVRNSFGLRQPPLRCAQPQNDGWPLDACAGKTSSCEAAFVSSNYQTGGASRRGESRFTPCSPGALLRLRGGRSCASGLGALALRPSDAPGPGGNVCCGAPAVARRTARRGGSG